MLSETVPGSTTPALRFSDVFILTSGFGSFWDAETDSQGEEVRPACGLIRGLRDAAVPVRLVGLNTADMEDVGLRAGPDEVVAARVAFISGLERKVVVWVQSVEETPLGSLLEELDRVQAIGRCTGQLINVIWPKVPPQAELELD